VPVTVQPVSGSDVARRYASGLELARRGAYFDAHEELELAWRGCTAEERDFFQGLVHVVVAWYQAGRGNAAGCGRQLEKAARRLGAYAPAHRGLDVAAVLAQVEAARERDDLELAPLVLDALDPEPLEDAVEQDVEPPVPLEEQQ
jgi:predicted metal-dependent hydrolase